MITRTVVHTAIVTALAASVMLSLSAYADSKEEITERVKPVGQLVIKADDSAKTTAGTDAAATTGAAADAGKTTYDTACFACHGTGAAGAPVVGKKDAWATRIEQGKDTLYKHALTGLNAMPAKGGNASLSDEDVKAAVDYMVGQSS